MGLHSRWLQWYLMVAVILGSEVTFAEYTDERLSELRETVRGMFYHGWNNYLDVAYPLDELKPISCSGLGRDYRNDNMIGPNDVLGDYSLTLIDSLDTLAILGDKDGFKQALDLVKARLVNFDIPSTVQVFEVTIRIMGGLLSGHIYATDPAYGMVIDEYDGFLLNLAKDLADRLMPAFDTPTGIPNPRVNLRYSNLLFSISETCAAGSGSLVLEFTTLSRLIGDEKYERAAKRGFFEIWDRRSPFNLVGTSIDSHTGMWLYPLSGIGASADSFYEYAVKSYVLLGGDEEFLNVSKLIMESVDEYLLDNWIYRNIHLESGSFLNGWIDSLSSFFPGLQVLYGNVPQAIRSYMVYYKLWMQYGAIPERWEAIPGHPQVTFAWYPLRPEFIESTYLLYQATKDPFYLYVGEQIIQDIQTLMKTDCGFAGLHNIETGSLDDRMESFFLSETVKYLYLLFTPDHVVNRDSSGAVFSTEAHLMKIPQKIYNTTTNPLKGMSSDSAVCRTIKQQQNGIQMVSKVLSWNQFDHLDAIFHYSPPSEAPAFINRSIKRKIVERPAADPLATCAPVEWTTQYDIQFSYKEFPSEEEVEKDYRQDVIKTRRRRSNVVRVANGDLEAPSFDGLRLVLREQKPKDTNSPKSAPPVDSNFRASDKNNHLVEVDGSNGIRILSVDGLPLGSGRRLRVTDLDRLDFNYNDVLDIGEDGRVYFRGQSIINLALSV